MPSFPFSATFDESMDLMRELSKEGFRIVLSHPVADPIVEYASVTDDLIEGLRLSPACFLLGPFTQRALATSVLSSGPHEGQRVIDPLVEGPVMELLVPREKIVDGTPTLLLGDLSRQARYRDHDTTASRPASPALKKAYLRATQMISDWATTDAELAFPIGRQALARWQSGGAMVQQYVVGPASTDLHWRVSAS